jgi:hypothetical protein
MMSSYADDLMPPTHSAYSTPAYTTSTPKTPTPTTQMSAALHPIGTQQVLSLLALLPAQKVQILTQPLQHTPTNFNTPTKGLTPIGTPTLAHSANAALALSDSPNGTYLRHMAGLRSGVSRAASADGWATAPGTPVLLPPLVYEALSHWCMRP